VEPDPFKQWASGVLLSSLLGPALALSTKDSIGGHGTALFRRPLYDTGLACRHEDESLSCFFGQESMISSRASLATPPPTEYVSSASTKRKPLKILRISGTSLIDRMKPRLMRPRRSAISWN
jgi:hypothetical protein